MESSELPTTMVSVDPTSDGTLCENEKKLDDSTVIMDESSTSGVTADSLSQNNVTDTCIIDKQDAHGIDKTDTDTHVIDTTATDTHVIDTTATDTNATDIHATDIHATDACMSPEDKLVYRDASSNIDVIDVKQDDGDSDYSSSSVSSSSCSSDESSSKETYVGPVGSSDEENGKKKPKAPIIKTIGEATLDDLPPIDELHITIADDIEMVEVGVISSIVGCLVIVQAKKDFKPLNIDTILFLDERKIMGQIFETFGPVVMPLYAVRFNTEDEISERGLAPGETVYYAPDSEELTKYVFLDQLKKLKGSDASWEHNNEPPGECVDYSDDEHEKGINTKGTDPNNTERPGNKRRKPRTRNRKPESNDQPASNQNRNHQGGRNFSQNQQQKPSLSKNPFAQVWPPRDPSPSPSPQQPYQRQMPNYNQPPPSHLQQQQSPQGQLPRAAMFGAVSPFSMPPPMGNFSRASPSPSHTNMGPPSNPPPGMGPGTTPTPPPPSSSPGMSYNITSSSPQAQNFSPHFPYGVNFSQPPPPGMIPQSSPIHGLSGVSPVSMYPPPRSAPLSNNPPPQVAPPANTPQGASPTTTTASGRWVDYRFVQNKTHSLLNPTPSPTLNNAIPQPANSHYTSQTPPPQGGFGYQQPSYQPPSFHLPGAPPSNVHTRPPGTPPNMSMMGHPGGGGGPAPPQFGGGAMFQGNPTPPPQWGVPQSPR